MSRQNNCMADACSILKNFKCEQSVYDNCIQLLPYYNMPVHIMYTMYTVQEYIYVIK